MGLMFGGDPTACVPEDEPDRIDPLQHRGWERTCETWHDLSFYADNDVYSEWEHATQFELQGFLGGVTERVRHTTCVSRPDSRQLADEAWEADTLVGLVVMHDIRDAEAVVSFEVEGMRGSLPMQICDLTSGE